MLKLNEKSQDLLRVVMIGDVVGRPGREGLCTSIPYLRNELGADLIVVNTENASGGVGLVPGTAKEILDSGVDIMTLGDHGLQRKEVHHYLDQHAAVCVRPANYPEGAPGRGWTIWKTPEGLKVGICNLMGRVFMNGALDCPFQKIDALLEGPLKECALVLVDFHAEATSEKVAFGHYLDGRVSLVVGTHTHVQTADAMVLEGGTGYMTDLGMTGMSRAVIGMDTKVALKRFRTGLHAAYKLGTGGPVLVCGVVADIHRETGKTVAIQQVRLDPEVIAGSDEE